MDVYFRSSILTRLSIKSCCNCGLREVLEVAAGGENPLKGDSGEEGQYPDEKSSWIYPQLALNLQNLK